MAPEIISPEVILIIKIVIAIALAVFLGNGSVVAFNRVSASWFLDYDDSAREEGASCEQDGADAPPRKVLPPKLVQADEAGRQRLPSTPWKYIFTVYFLLAGIYLATREVRFDLGLGIIFILSVVLLMAIADGLYQVVPDQFSYTLAILSVVFLTHHEKWWESLAGAGLGLGISLFILGIGLLIFKTGSIGGADIKFFTCMGLAAGRSGIVIIYVLTTLIFAAWSAIRIAGRRGSIKESLPMLPAALIATTIYYLFIWNVSELMVFEL